MADNTINLDAFQGHLHGSKILCQGPFTKGAFPPVLEAIENIKLPFQKKVLLTNNDSLSIVKPFSLVYDAIFRISTTTDWSLALTYILHAPKDVLVVAEDIPIPDAVWSKLNKSITFLSIVKTPLKNVFPYDAVFFAPIEDFGTVYASDTVYKAVLALTRKPYGPKEYKDILQELRVANAGLAWTRGSESLFWYDPVSENSEQLSKKQLAELFSWLSSQFNA
jgi:hypothetical protein